MFQRHEVKEVKPLAFLREVERPVPRPPTPTVDPVAQVSKIAPKIK